MNIAIVSDIHSNLEAYEKVLEHIAAKGIDEILCFGDVVGYGPDPIKCIDLTRDKCRFIVMGNHDEAMLQGPIRFSPSAEGAIDWTRETMKKTLFNQDDMQPRWDFLENLPLRQSEDEFLYVHGSPRNPTTEYIFQAEAAYGPSQKWEEIFAAFKQAVFVGHTHMPCVIEEDLKTYRPLKTTETYTLGKKKAIINVGSVGQPRDGDNRACYITFDGKVATFHRVPYDFNRTKEKIEAVPELDDRLLEGY